MKLINQTSQKTTLAAFALLCLLSFFLAVGSGELTLDWQGIFNAAQTPAQTIFWELRLPRAVAALSCGALLAAAGAMMQILLKNPLADPYILGVSGGASLAAVSAISLGLNSYWIDGSAFAGALITMALVLLLGYRHHDRHQTRLLLTGIVVAAGCGALVTLMLILSNNQEMRVIIFWLMGDLSTASSPWLALAASLLLPLLLLPWLGDLNILARGELVAENLGVRINHLRLLLIILSALATAIAVSLAGPIGFIGLIVPHLVRLLVGNNQRQLIPCAMFAGAALLLLADTAARTLTAPEQLPVGSLMAFIGVPIFLVLLSRSTP